MPDIPVESQAETSAVGRAFWAVGLFCIFLLLIFHQTSSSIVAIWLRSDTFAHGFIILPISLWLLWSMRSRLALISPRPTLWVAILIIPVGFAWLLAWLVDVLVVQQLALIAMLVIGTWSILGHQLARAIAFPLLFLFFAVPMGEALIPPMMEFTATSTVWLIQLSGIPVYREGLYFTLPSGNWSVVEACSGVRYIIASLTLGVIYAYLTYRSLWRRSLFVLASIITPILANTLRAYIIVMLGHASDMSIATGADHLVYGWAFFGVVMFIIFWVGSSFRQDDVTRVVSRPDNSICSNESRPWHSGTVATTLGVLLLVSIWPSLANTIISGSVHDSGMELALPEARGGWRALPLTEFNWQPSDETLGQIAAGYELNGDRLGIFIQYHAGGPEGGEIVGNSRRFVAKGSGFRLVEHRKVTAQLAGTAVRVDQARLQSTKDQFLAWSWYRIGDMHTSNDYLAKFGEALASLGIERPGSYRIVVATQLGDSVESSQRVLQDFLKLHLGPLNLTLDSGAGGV